jgi:hypothetical protein
MIVTRLRAKSSNGHIIQSYIRSYVRELEDSKYEPDYSHVDSTVFNHILEYLKLELLIVPTTLPNFTVVVPPFTTIQQLKELFDERYGCPPWMLRFFYRHTYHYICERIIDIVRPYSDRIFVIPCLVGHSCTGPTAKKRRAERRVRRLRKQGITEENVIPFFKEVKGPRIIPFRGRALTRYVIQKRAEDKENGWVY